LRHGPFIFVALYGTFFARFAALIVGRSTELGAMFESNKCSGRTEAVETAGWWSPCRSAGVMVAVWTEDGESIEHRFG